jgi:uncharacterized membrane protein YczE
MLKIKVWSKRLLVYLAGLFIMAVGVVFSVKSALGVSPVTCLANVVSQMTAYDVGTCTTAVYCLYILVEIIILRRDFKPQMLLQILASFLFGTLVTLAGKIFAFLPAPTTYIMRMVFLLASIPMVAFGVMLYLAPQILPTPGEGMSLAISKKTGLTVASSKMIFDCSLVVISAVTSLVYFHGFVGVREGTVISALTVGVVMKQMMKFCQRPLLKFVERDDKVEQAIAASVLDVKQAVKPKILITVSREFGSGGYEIAQKLAKELDIKFYDKELIPLEAAESGLTEEYINNVEERMKHSVFQNYLETNYAFHSGTELSPSDRLYVARNAIFRRIAASDESCIIMGRCSNYILKDDDRCFRIFIHAKPAARLKRIIDSYGVDSRRAKFDMENTDRARERHYKQFTGSQWGDTKYYDLAVDSGVFGVDGSVELIKDAVRVWYDRFDKN